MKQFLCLVLCSFFLFTGCTKTSYFESTDQVEQQVEPEGEADQQGNLESNNDIFVQVAGAVQHPDVYQLPQGSRVFAAIEAAGGLLESADDSDLNQASLLEDGQKIYIYTVEENKGRLDSEAEAEANDGLININTASIEEFKTLPGIGESKASQIVSYRDSKGEFSSIEDIKNVSGIGDGIFNQIKSLIKI